MEDTLLENYIINSDYDLEEEPNRLSFCNLDLTGSGSLQESPKTPPTQIDQSFTFQPGPAYSNPDPDINFNEDEELNEYHKRDYFSTIKSHSFRKPSLISDQPDNQRLSNSTRSKYKTGSMSGKSRRRMFMFWPMIFNPEMELSEIKQRQARLRATAESGGAGKSTRWEVLRSILKGRSSLGCVRMAGGLVK